MTVDKKFKPAQCIYDMAVEHYTQGGGGYYDRLLSGLPKHIPVIAPAFEEQIMDSIPSEPHDIKVDMIVTDRQLIRCYQ